MFKKILASSLLCLCMLNLSGCQNNEVSDSAEVSGNIALTQQDTALRLNKIATNVTSSESGFSSQIIKMIQSTTTVTDSDYQSLNLKLESALKTIDSSLKNIDEFTCPPTMTEKRDTVRTAIESYKNALIYIQSACDEKDIGKMKVGYETYISAINSITAATSALN